MGEGRPRALRGDEDEEEEWRRISRGMHWRAEAQESSPGAERSGGPSREDEKPRVGLASEAAEDEGESGIRRPAWMRGGATPSEEERREHELTHVPYRSWCHRCVWGRGPERNQ